MCNICMRRGLYADMSQDPYDMFLYVSGGNKITDDLFATLLRNYQQTL